MVIISDEELNEDYIFTQNNSFTEILTAELLILYLSCYLSKSPICF